MWTITASGRDALVVMVESAKVRAFDHAAAIDGLNFARLRAVHLQTLVSAPPMVIAKVGGQGLPEMPLIEHDHMIQALAADRADKPFRIRIGPSLRMHPMRLLSVDVSE